MLPKICIFCGDQILNTSLNLLFTCNFILINGNLWKSKRTNTFTSKMMLHGRKQTSNGRNWRGRQGQCAKGFNTFIKQQHKEELELKNQIHKEKPELKNFKEKLYATLRYVRKKEVVSRSFAMKILRQQKHSSHSIRLKPVGCIMK